MILLHCGERGKSGWKDTGQGGQAGSDLGSDPGRRVTGLPIPHPTASALGLVAPLTRGWGTCFQVAQLPLSLKDNGWHHICIAWTTRDGLWSAYHDGELRGSGENLAAWHPIKPHGILILGQEQVRVRVGCN